MPIELQFSHLIRFQTESSSKSHKITNKTAVFWDIHTKIRNGTKSLTGYYKLLANCFPGQKPKALKPAIKFSSLLLKATLIPLKTVQLIP